MFRFLIPKNPFDNPPPHNHPLSTPKAHAAMKDRIQLLFVSLIIAALAWGFWRIAGRDGFSSS